MGPLNDSPPRCRSSTSSDAAGEQADDASFDA